MNKLNELEKSVLIGRYAGGTTELVDVTESKTVRMSTSNARKHLKKRMVEIVDEHWEDFLCKKFRDAINSKLIEPKQTATKSARENSKIFMNELYMVIEDWDQLEEDNAAGRHPFADALDEIEGYEDAVIELFVACSKRRVSQIKSQETRTEPGRRRTNMQGQTKLKSKKSAKTPSSRPMSPTRAQVSRYQMRERERRRRTMMKKKIRRTSETLS